MRSAGFAFRFRVLHFSQPPLPPYRVPITVASLSFTRLSFPLLPRLLRAEATSREAPSPRRLSTDQLLEHDLDPFHLNALQTVESFLLVTAVVAQTIPVIYRSAYRIQSKEGALSRTPVEVERGQNVETREQILVPTQVLGADGVSAPGYVGLMPVVSFCALLLAVMTGAFLRRVCWQKITMPSIQRQPSRLFTVLDREEMEDQISRAFSEISQLVGQVDRVRIKLRLVSSEYGPIIESTAQDTSRLRTSIQNIARQIQSMEERLGQVDEVLLKLEGVASKQFQIVSFALRRLDSECQELKTQLSHHQQLHLSEEYEPESSSIEVEPTG